MTDDDVTKGALAAREALANLGRESLAKCERLARGELTDEDRREAEEAMRLAKSTPDWYERYKRAVENQQRPH